MSDEFLQQKFLYSDGSEMADLKLLGTEGQYRFGGAFQSNPGSSYNMNLFNSPQDVLSFVQVSRVGFEPPCMELIFSFSNQDLLAHMNERNFVFLSIGKDIDSQQYDTYSIITAEVKEQGQGRWVARLVGISLSYGISYLKTPQARSVFGTSIDCFKKVFEDRKIALDVPAITPRDKMPWIQAAQSDFRWLYKVWLSSYIPHSMWLPALLPGKVKARDLRAEVAKLPPEVVLTTGNPDTEHKVYAVLPTFDVVSDSSSGNNFGGYVERVPFYTIDSGIKDIAKKAIQPILSECDIYNKAKNVYTQAAPFLMNSNLHSHAPQAAINNQGMYQALKAQRIEVSAEGAFLPAEPLDYLIFKDPTATGSAQKDYSGVYMVGKNAVQLQQGKVYNHIELWRESMNEIAGSKNS